MSLYHVARQEKGLPCVARLLTPPSLLTCQPVQLQWSAGTAPYFLSVLPGGDASAVPLKNFGQQSGTSLTWNVDLPAGTAITLAITDSTGENAYSSIVTIQEGASTSCSGDAPATAGGNGAASSAVEDAASSATGAIESIQSRATSAANAVSSIGASIASRASSAVSAPRSSAPATDESSAALPMGKVGLATLLTGAAASFFLA